MLPAGPRLPEVRAEHLLGHAGPVVRDGHFAAADGDFDAPSLSECAGSGEALADCVVGVLNVLAQHREGGVVNLPSEELQHPRRLDLENNAPAHLSHLSRIRRMTSRTLAS